MVNLHWTALGLAAALLPSGVVAHPGGNDEAFDLEVRAAELRYATRAMSICAEKHQANGFAKRNAERRYAKAAATRKERGIESNTWSMKKRSLDSLFQNHRQTMDFSGLDPDNIRSAVFEGNNATCILSSDAMVGPYYVDGELIRTDIAENEGGVPLKLDLQIIDMNTCEAMTGKYVDIWAANATGVYSGVVARGNGNSADTSNMNNTFGRGLAPTDEEGVVEYNTLLPGHYTGRAHHIHVIAHQEGQVLPNNTFESGRASHVGQIYFDQDLVLDAEKLDPYTLNRQPLTKNADDFILQQQLAQSDADPFVDYSLVGDDLSQGIYGWITLAINPSASFDTPAASHWTEHGGVPADNTWPPAGAPPTEE